MWWNKENPPPRLPFAVVEKSLDGYLPEFERGTNVDIVTFPDGDFSYSPINDRDKYTTGAMCGIVVLAQGKHPDGSRMLSVLFDIDPRSVDSFGFMHKPPYFKVEFPGIMRQLRDNTVKDTRIVGIVGGYVGDGGGKLPGLNRSFYDKMVNAVSEMSYCEHFTDVFILQPPKQVRSYTDVYWETQKGNITIVTRHDLSPHLPGE